MAEQRQRAKQDSLEKKTGNADISVFAGLLAKSGPVIFTGYDEISGEATVTGLLAGGVKRPRRGARSARAGASARRGHPPSPPACAGSAGHPDHPRCPRAGRRPGRKTGSGPG